VAFVFGVQKVLDSYLDSGPAVLTDVSNARIASFDTRYLQFVKHSSYLYSTPDLCYRLLVHVTK